MPRCSLIAFIAALVAAVPAAARPATILDLRSPRNLVGFSADQAGVAVAIVGAGCPRVVLASAGVATKRFGGPDAATCRSLGFASPQFGRPLGLALQRAIWLVETASGTAVVAGLAGAPEEEVLDRAARTVTQVGPVAASDWLRLYGRAGEAGRVTVSARSRVLVGDGAAFMPMSVDRRERIALLGPNGELRLFEQHGRGTLCADDRADLVAVAVDGDRLVGVRSDARTIEVRNLRCRRLATYRSPLVLKPLADLAGRIAIMPSRLTVVVLDLRTGRTWRHASCRERQRLVDAQIERNLVTWACAGRQHTVVLQSPVTIPA